MVLSWLFRPQCAACGDQSVERSTFQILENDIRCTVRFLASIEDLHDVWMGYGGDRLGFTEQARAKHEVIFLVFPKLLDGHDFAGEAVRGLVHDARAAAAYLAAYRVASIDEPWFV